MRLTGTIDAELADFQRFLLSAMPWGARVSRVDANYEEPVTIGTASLLCSCVSVLEVGLAQTGTYYVVNFGPEDVYGPAAQEETDPAASWTVTVSDPLVSLANGRYAIETLDASGQSFEPEEWLLINPMLLADDLHRLHQARGGI